MKYVTLLGATGSIGQQTLDIIKRHSDAFSVFALTAQSNVSQMLRDCLTFKPRYAVMTQADAAKSLETQLKAHHASTEVLAGEQALCDVASHGDVDMVMAGIVGSGGLNASLAAASSGKTVLLANKEALVMSGQLFMDAARKSQAQIFPVDSEHNAVFQCYPALLSSSQRSALKKVFITASGGPFLGWSREQLKDVTPAQAVKHPNWSMGQKISVDSATMANKGLEYIEARYLFGLDAEQLGVILHPQSVVHALVEFIDGSVLSHMGEPDMRVPISHALGCGERIVSGADALHLLSQKTTLNFEPIITGQFPCFDLAVAASQSGECHTIVLNAANEVAVTSFLQGSISFLAIEKILEQTLNRFKTISIQSIDDVNAVDSEARKLAHTHIQQLRSHAYV